jgi:hypothetical protein
MVIRGREPVIVDTGAPVHRERWLEKVFAVVEPEDVRWVFLSHDDGDHTGALFEVLERCPQRHAGDQLLQRRTAAAREAGAAAVAHALDRARWQLPRRRPRASAVPPAGLRRPHLARPVRPEHGAMWMVDTFACFTPGPLDADELPQDLLASCMPALMSAISPWHSWLDGAAYTRHVDAIEALGARTVASAHGPVLRGERLDDAFDRLRAMAGAPNILTPGQELLDALLAPTLAEAG